MTVITSYPGVYLSEDATSSFSINNATTSIPVFAVSNEDGALSDIKIYYNWSEFFTEHNKKPFSDNTYTSLRLWFTHGGGKCYLASEDKITNVVTQYDEITLIVSAGAGSTVMDASTELSSKGYRIFALFDGPKTKISSTDTPSTVMADYPATAYGAVFYPWGTLKSGEDVPPSAIAAASITLTDSTRGVWKAPANQPLNGVTPKYLVSDDMQGRFNQGKALNMVRNFSDTGTVVWGARTLDDSDNWRYIPVRRLFNTIERDIKDALNKMVFEPNNQPTWKRVEAAVNSYLYSLWQQGALAGNKQDEAWFVQIGKDITMTQEQIDQGKMIIKVGVAAVRPAEFIILQFSQNIAQ